jgi:hypothetical protein
MKQNGIFGTTCLMMLKPGQDPFMMPSCHPDQHFSASSNHIFLAKTIVYDKSRHTISGYQAIAILMDYHCEDLKQTAKAHFHPYHQKRSKENSLQHKHVSRQR